MPPMMPFVHDLLWLGAFAGAAFLAWKVATRFGFASNLPSLRQPMTYRPSAPSPTWFTTTTRSSGNIAFDEWRDRELARIEAERRALEARLVAFEAFVDNLKRAKDRETFERFTAQFREAPAATDRPG